jgi:GT2 family glycosyltransferase
LGIVKWHHNAKNENLKVFEKVGIEINYTKIMNPEDCNFNYFCTANIGLSKELLLTEQFDENFPYPAMEDTELGYRFSRKGIKIILNQKAIVYHLHHYDEDALIKRQEKIGKSTKELVKKYPELKSLFIKPNPKVIFVLAVIFKNVLRVVNKNKRFLKDLYWLALATYSKYRYCI